MLPMRLTQSDTGDKKKTLFSAKASISEPLNNPRAAHCMFISHVPDERLTDADAHYLLVLLHLCPVRVITQKQTGPTRAQVGEVIFD